MMQCWLGAGMDMLSLGGDLQRKEGGWRSGAVKERHLQPLFSAPISRMPAQSLASHQCSSHSTCPARCITCLPAPTVDTHRLLSSDTQPLAKPNQHRQLVGWLTHKSDARAACQCNWETWGIKEGVSTGFQSFRVQKGFRVHFAGGGHPAQPRPALSEAVCTHS